MNKYPKPIKKQLNTLMSVAYERELTRELTQLAARFDDWRAGKIEAGELHDLIHQYHQGPGLEIYKRYDFRDADWTVARAVVLERVWKAHNRAKRRVMINDIAA